MKNLAELISELSKIPNPEKVGVAYLNRDDELELMPKHFDMSRPVRLDVLPRDGIKQAIENGFTEIVTF